jgi:hypothetical protein
MGTKKDIEIAPKVRKIALKNPDDGRRLIRRVIAKIFEQNSEVANAGKIANLLNTWAGLWELEKAVDLENRIAAIEKQQKEEEFRRKAYERKSV